MGDLVQDECQGMVASLRTWQLSKGGLTCSHGLEQGDDVEAGLQGEVEGAVPEDRGRHLHRNDYVPGSCGENKVSNN